MSATLHGQSSLEVLKQRVQVAKTVKRATLDDVAYWGRSTQAEGVGGQDSSRGSGGARLCSVQSLDGLAWWGRSPTKSANPGSSNQRMRDVGPEQAAHSLQVEGTGGVKLQGGQSLGGPACQGRSTTHGAELGSLKERRWQSDLSRPTLTSS